MVILKGQAEAHGFASEVIMSTQRMGIQKEQVDPLGIEFLAIIFILPMGTQKGQAVPRISEYLTDIYTPLTATQKARVVRLGIAFHNQQYIAYCATASKSCALEFKC